MADQPRKYRSVHSVGARYECHPSSVWRWIKQGKFPAPVRIGGMTRWLESELDAHDAQAAARRDAVAA